MRNFLVFNLCFNSGRSDLEVETLGNGGVHIKSVIAGLSITLKNVDNTYMLVLRIAEGQTLGADGLLYAGCRSNEQINRADEIGKQYFHVFMYHINYAPISLCKFMAFVYFYN